MRKDLRIEDLTAVIDSRENLPLNLFPMTEITSGLQTGDYSLLGCEHLIAVERKSPGDFIGCVGQGRERFDRELERMPSYRYRALVIECSYNDLRNGADHIYQRSRVKPNAAVACAVRWSTRGVPVHFAGDRAGAEHFVKSFLWLAAKELWEESSSLHQQLRIATKQREMVAE
jgi:DNA excision repair protein ERCC-4